MQRAIYVATDWFTTFVAFLLFDILRFYFYADHHAGISLHDYLTSNNILAEQIIFPVGMLAVYWLSGYYNNVSEKSRLSEFLTTLTSAVFNALFIYLLLLINDFAGRRAYDYELILALTSILFVCTYTGRLLITTSVIRQYRTQRWRYNTVIAGMPREARKMQRRIERSNNGLYYKTLGFIDMTSLIAGKTNRKGGDKTNEGKESTEGNPDYMSFAELKKLAQEGNVDQVILAPRTSRDKETIAALQLLFPLNIAIKIVPDTLSFITPTIRLNNVLDEPLIDLSRPTISESSKNIKRVFDVVASGLAMIALSPLMAAISLAIRLKGGKGPVFYSQERIGCHKRPFKIYKFRTMRIDAEADGPQLSSDSDSRITPIGRWLRKYRLDELPQFWNVVRGDMSIVGPRPEREFFIRQIVKCSPQYALLHQVRPGITSWGMVKYGYAKSVNEMVKRSKFDLIYLNNMSLAMDLKIMIYTIRTIITGKGV